MSNATVERFLFVWFIALLCADGSRTTARSTAIATPTSSPYPLQVVVVCVGRVLIDAVASFASTTGFGHTLRAPPGRDVGVTPPWSRIKVCRVCMYILIVAFDKVGELHCTDWSTTMVGCTNSVYSPMQDRSDVMFLSRPYACLIRAGYSTRRHWLRFELCQRTPCLLGGSANIMDTVSSAVGLARVS